MNPSEAASVSSVPYNPAPGGVPVERDAILGRNGINLYLSQITGAGTSDDPRILHTHVSYTSTYWDAHKLTRQSDGQSVPFKNGELITFVEQFNSEGSTTGVFQAIESPDLSIVCIAEQYPEVVHNVRSASAASPESEVFFAPRTPAFVEGEGLGMNETNERYAG